MNSISEEALDVLVNVIDEDEEFGGEIADALRQFQQLRMENARIRAVLQDSAAVHTSILMGQMALAKPQAIHIAGLPANVEGELQQLRLENAAARRLIERAFIKCTDGELTEELYSFIEPPAKGKP